MKVVLFPQAKRDLDAIFDPLFSRIVCRLRMLESFPEMGAAMLGPFAGYLSTVVGLFRVVYRIHSHTVEVAYIRDCRRA